MKNDLSMPGMLAALRDVFKKTPDKSNGNISLLDCLFSGFALFSLKYSSLLQYDNERKEYAGNLKNLFGINQAPCDTYLRERLDEVDPKIFRAGFKRLFRSIQRGKCLENYVYHQGHYLISVDATGYFSSNTVHCENCCEKHHRDGSTTYYHQMLAAAVVHPDLKQVIPFAPEPISKQDGHKKNDCERNAARRLLSDLRREHPHLAITVTEDALYGNGPHLELLKHLNMRFIIGVKKNDHAWLFDYVDHAPLETYSVTDAQGYQHNFKYINDAPLNETHDLTRVNFLRYTEISPKGKKKVFTWITDFRLTQKTVFSIMRGGRARWKIENETFNTLKNQGYNFEHNFGHGYQHLSHNFANLMLLAFLVDQILAMACPEFQSALKKEKRLSYLWKRIFLFFQLTVIDDWESLYRHIAKWKGPTAMLDST